jgi:hypothetical protein
MTYRILADVVVLTHGAFVLFVVLGALLALRWPRVAWVHLPALAWGALIEFRGWTCPLTPLENGLRRAAGARGYDGGFVEQYLIPLIYPPGLDRSHQWLLGLAVVLVNACLYALVIRRRRRRRAPADGTGVR